MATRAPRSTGEQLVLSYSDTSSLDANPAHKPATEDFTVRVKGVSNAVTAVTVDAQTKTVTLTLTTPVVHGQGGVTVAYADPTTSNDTNAIQDAAGNDAASIPITKVINNTKDTTPPQINMDPSCYGNALTLRFSDTSNLDVDHKPASGDFTVLVNGAANTVTRVRVGAEHKCIYLTLATSVRLGQEMTVAYQDSSPDDSNGIQDTAGNRLTRFTTTWVSVERDNSAPRLITDPHSSSSPKVKGNQLVLGFYDASDLDAAPTNKPFTSDFTVLVNGVANAVSAVAVNAQAKTIALTLTTAVTPGQTTTVAYSMPNDGTAIRDAAGNRLTSFAATAVNTDIASPQLITTGSAGPRTNRSRLMLEFSDTSNLDVTEGHEPLSGDFTVLVDGVANTVTSVIADYRAMNARIIYLALATPVRHGQSVTVAYQDSTPNDSNAIQDTAGNRLTRFTTTQVDNCVGKDDFAPQLITVSDTTSPRVNGNQLVLSFGDISDLDADPTHKPVAGDFAVLVNGVANAVTAVAVNAQAKTMTLTLATAVTPGQTATVAYTDSTPTDTSAIQDAVGNRLTRFAATAVNTADTAPPQLIATGATGPKVNGKQLVLSFSDTNHLDMAPTRKPTTGDFAVLVNGVPNAVTAVAVNATHKTVTLTLGTAVTNGQSVTVAYNDPTPGDDTNAIQDVVGNDANSFAATAVENLTPVLPTESLAPTPAASTKAPGADSGGVSSAQEDLADGNGDGIADSAQAAVSSLRATMSSSSGTSVTLVAGSQDGKVPSGSNARITSLEQKAVPAEMPRELKTPIALTSFQAALNTVGSSETFSLYVDPKIGANGYWLQDNTGTWVNLASSPYGGKMVNEGGRLRLDFQIKDGGQFDADGLADGVITAPGAAAKMPLSIVGLAPDVAHDGFWF
ncbi:hypothetical protein D8B24_09055 [Verminephrobacter aporrectodeae subsp. tuberculatae]|uniref:SwmB domain-containing protein n=1 Tax=Verminephrobacter aporrectodeae TaxID=1110389 RepID=UPI002244BAD4|nr:SwmB domain-containing protein [Verminephrobacter aporrectodeae]MCW8207190.1 hypothetical protein [Verminephrobacter aporrectodeae subsp. tuberculatae]